MELEHLHNNYEFQQHPYTPILNENILISLQEPKIDVSVSVLLFQVFAFNNLHNLTIDI